MTASRARRPVPPTTSPMNTSRMTRDSGSPITVGPMRESVQPLAAERALVLEAREITKRFGEREALRGVSLEASRGELVAIIGPNGAGKTTLLSILAGIQKAGSGSVSRSPGEIGWVPQQAAVYSKLTVAENLRLFARLEKCRDVEGVVQRMLAKTGLEDRSD